MHRSDELAPPSRHPHVALARDLALRRGVGPGELSAVGAALGADEEGAA